MPNPNIVTRAATDMDASVSGRPVTPPQVKSKLSLNKIRLIQSVSRSQKNYTKNLFFEIFCFEYMKERNVLPNSKELGFEKDVVE